MLITGAYLPGPYYNPHPGIGLQHRIVENLDWNPHGLLERVSNWDGWESREIRFWATLSPIGGLYSYPVTRNSIENGASDSRHM
jgi:hypothetical protein